MPNIRFQAHSYQKYFFAYVSIFLPYLTNFQINITKKSKRFFDWMTSQFNSKGMYFLVKIIYATIVN